MKKIFTVVLIFLFSGCNVEPPNDVPGENTDTEVADVEKNVDEDIDKGKVSLSDLKLQKPQSCTDLKRYIIESLVKRYTEFNFFGNRLLVGDDVATDSGVPEVTAKRDESGPSALNTSSGTASLTGVSETNVQEKGVDEPDIVKTDSEGNIYIIHGTKLIISAGFPPSDMKTVSTVELKSYLNGLHIDEKNNLLIISGNYYYRGETDRDILPAKRNGIRTVFLDVRDLENPVVQKEIFIEGRETGSRRVENRIHMVSSFTRELPESLQTNQAFWDLLREYWQLEADAPPASLPVPMPVGATRETALDVSTSFVPGETTTREKPLFASKRAEILQTLKTMITDAVQNSDIKDFFPKAFEKRDGTWNAIPLLSCSDIFFPKVSLTPGLLVVSSFDTDGQNMKSSAIVNNAWQIYSSKENLYVFQSSNGWWFNRSQKTQSAVYKFKISQEGPLYTAAGTFSGWINDQFSVSEHKGYLRLVTTSRDIEEDSGRNQTVNNLFTLKENDSGELEIAGKVTGLAPGERVFSARFLGDRGFVVTFRNIDPLFSFDLSDPENPLLTGELKIPGFSTYMHPISDSHLLTIGREDNMLQLQIFDVSDLSSPKLLHKETPDANDVSGKYVYTYSSAAYDHHAFTYYAPEKILVFPYSYSWYGDRKEFRHFNGFLSYRVSIEDGFKETGRVDHSDLAKQKYCSEDGVSDQKRPWICQNQNYIYYGNPRRSIIMTTEEDTYLYSLSNVGLKATPINDPKNVLGSIIFPKQRFGWWWGIY